MGAQRLKIKLHTFHKKTGLTPYMVGKLTGVNKSTVAKYGDGDVIMEKLENAVLVLAKFYGVDWRDPAIVESIEDKDEGEITTQKKRFNIHLHNVHREKGLTVSQVAKLTGVNKHMVQKYVGNGDIITERLESEVLELATFYGVDWRDPSIVEEIEDTDET